MSKTICGASCEGCRNIDRCPGCEATGGRPFGGACVAAKYIKAGGLEQYTEFKNRLLGEINSLLREAGIPEAEALYELPGVFVNLRYPLPGGQTAAFLDDTKVYLGTQVMLGDTGLCCGVIADTDFILVSRYGADGSEPELISYRKR